jgi:nucleoside-diphosphate-sugar epimerase
MAHYLVTGGAGFIGSNIVERLLKKGEKVTVLDNFSTGKEENLRFSNSFSLIKADIRDLDTCKKACQGVDFVLHQAALGSVPRSIKDPSSTHEVNVTGTLNMLLAARENNIKRFIYASSSSVYGDQHSQTKSKHGHLVAKVENMIPNPQSPYAVSKLAGEYYCRVFSKNFSLATISLRYFNVFGKRQDPFSQYAAVIPLFFQAVLNAESPHIFGDGNQSRDFTFIDNVVEANILSCQAESHVSGNVFNVACGSNITVNELFERVLDLTGKKISPVYDPPRPGDVKHSLADISRAKEILGYRVVRSFEEGLKDTAIWYQHAHR